MNYPTTRSSLLERVQQGDEISWNEFYYRYSPVIRAAGAGIKFNNAECDDLVQAVMLKIFNRAQTFVYKPVNGKFRTYFARVVHNQAVDMIRRNNVQKNLPGEPIDACDPFDELFDSEWRKAALAEAKAELRLRVSDKTFMAFELYSLQNRPLKTVAKTLEMTPDQIYVAKNRCIKILQEIIRRYNEIDGALHLEI